MNPKQNPPIPPTPASNGGNGSNGGGDGYVAWYTHYRTGKLMIPSEYGYKAWRFGKKKKSTKK